MNYLDIDLTLTEDDIELKKAAHRFAKEVMRPIAKKLDEMTPEQVIAKDSPFWEFMRKAYELGYHTILIPESYGGMDLTSKQQAIIFEELAWGSFGLTVALGVASFPAFGASLVAEEELIEKFIVPYCECKDASIIGCWGITEPDHGSDTLMPQYPSFSDPNIKAQCRARKDGDEWVISGQKSAWVSCGTVATHCALFCQSDPSMGHAGGMICVVPLDLPGVSKGKPLNKLGQRDLNQGEIFFDNVRIPQSYVIGGADAYEALLEIVLSTTTAFMGYASAGLARAAFEEALEYAKNRVQGGKRLVEFPNIQMKLFHMFSKVELTRYYSRMAYMFNQNTSTPAEEYSIIAKVFGTNSAYEVAHDAIQIFGGNGLTKEYLIEKLYRDARATLIEDGSNDTLAIAGGHKMIHNYPRLDM
ncbi:MAG: acyl-CoA/acyl-ACP dehydrogenase [Desulfobacterales bacterium]|jgi:alkylation response protein AidB-like acyl-CoA dehydrogenase|nr:acyl-CoA/acyl-ACP dehydrogenase [Desulfobacterales bacterium]